MYHLGGGKGYTIFILERLLFFGFHEASIQNQNEFSVLSVLSYTIAYVAGTIIPPRTNI